MIEAPIRLAWYRVFSSAVNSANSSITSRDVKRHIHRLYQHIHPDRLASFPKEQNINETSFQVLQSALDRYFQPVKTPAAATSAPPTKLTFYARSDNAKGLCKAVVTFHDHSLATVLKELFTGLGLEPPPHNILSAIGPLPRPQTSQFRLRDLVERARQVRATVTTEHASQQLDDVSVSRLTTQRACGIRLNLCNSVPFNARAMAAKRVRDALASSSIDSTGIEVTVDGGADTLVAPGRWAPRLTLGILASQTRWLDTVNSSTFEKVCIEARDCRLTLQEAEKSAAAALGVRIVLCATDVHGEVSDTLLDAYADALSQISRAATNGEIKNPHGSWRAALAVMVNEGDAVDVDVETGLLHVGVALGANGIIEAVAGSQQLAQTAEVRRQKKAAEAKLITDTRRLIRAARLHRQNGLPQAAWEDGLRALQRKAGVLREVISGVSVVVGMRGRVLGRGKIEIPYNFEKWTDL